MSTQLLLACLLIADVILCLAIIVLIVIINKEAKKRRIGPDQETIAEFRKLLDESQSSTNLLVEVMNESRKSLKEMVYILEDKEEKLKVLVEESKREYEKLKAKSLQADGNVVDKKYEDVITMVKQGLTKKEISQRLELTEGEIDLIVDLERTRNSA